MVFPETETAQQETAKTPTGVGVQGIGDVMRRCRQRWHGNVERKDDPGYVKACTRLVVEGNAPVGMPKKTLHTPRDVHN